MKRPDCPEMGFALSQDFWGSCSEVYGQNIFCPYKCVAQCTSSEHESFYLPKGKKVDILEWDEDEYTARPATSDGKFRSGVLSDFALDPTLFWEEGSPDPFVLMRLVEAMTGKTFGE